MVLPETAVRWPTSQWREAEAAAAAEAHTAGLDWVEWTEETRDRAAHTSQSHSTARPLSTCLFSVNSWPLALGYCWPLSMPCSMGNSSTRRPKHGDARIFRSQNITIFPQKDCTPNLRLSRVTVTMTYDPPKEFVRAIYSNAPATKIPKRSLWRIKIGARPGAPDRAESLPRPKRILPPTHVYRPLMSGR